MEKLRVKLTHLAVVTESGSGGNRLETPCLLIQSQGPCQYPWPPLIGAGTLLQGEPPLPLPVLRAVALGLFTL